MQRFLLICLVTSFGVFALPSQNAAAEDALERSVQQFFADYQEATQDESGAALIELFDVNELLRVCSSMANVELPEPMRLAMVAAMNQQLGAQLQMGEGVWFRHKITRITPIDDGDAAEVYVRSWSEDGVSGRAIYQLHETPNGWRLYDYSDISTGLAMSSMTAVALADLQQNGMDPKTRASFALLLQSAVAMSQGDLDTANSLMNELEGQPVPFFFESVRWMFRSAIAIAYSDPEALHHLDKTIAFQPDFPLVDLLRSTAFNSMNRPQAAIDAAQRYLDLFGDDADAFYQVALGHIALEQNEQAIAALRKGLEDTPTSLECLEELALLLPNDQKKAIEPHFARQRDPSAAFDYLANSFEYAGDKEAMRVLLNALEPQDESQSLLGYYQAWLLGQDDKHVEAYELLLARVEELEAMIPADFDGSEPAEDDSEWEAMEAYDALYWYGLLANEEAILSGNVMERYMASNDRQVLFAELIESVAAAERVDAMQPLIEVHLKAFADSAADQELVGFYYLDLERHEQADIHFAAAIGQLLKERDALPETADADDDLRIELRSNVRYLVSMRIDCLESLDKPVEAIKQIVPQEIVSEILASREPTQDEVNDEEEPEEIETTESEAAGGYDPYFTMNQIVFFATEPVSIEANDLSTAIERAWGKRILQLDRSAITSQEDDYTCQLSPNSVVIAIDGQKFFVTSQTGPYREDAEKLATELVYDPADDLGLSSAIQNHGAWISVDAYVWHDSPNIDDEESVGRIPLATQQMVARLADEMVGESGTVAYHPTFEMTSNATPSFRKRLRSDAPMSAFLMGDPVKVD